MMGGSITTRNNEWLLRTHRLIITHEMTNVGSHREELMFHRITSSCDRRRFFH